MLLAPTTSSRQSPSSGGVIVAEASWRELAGPQPGCELPRIIVSRWQPAAAGTKEVAVTTADDCYVLSIALRRMDLRLTVNGQQVIDGVVMPWMFHLSEPGTTARCLFRTACDMLHLRLPLSLAQECALRAEDNQAHSLHGRPWFYRDAIVERLAVTLLEADSGICSFSDLYVHCLGTAMISRLLELCGHGVQSESGAAAAGLIKWRLRRALEFIDAQLDQRIRLADIAAAAGLSRMHFAAQFRGTVGVPPHEYVLRRRIEQAQELLRQSEGSLAETALAVGFQTQSHFTTVFKRFVGTTPHAWRQAEARSRLGWTGAQDTWEALARSAAE